MSHAVQIHAAPYSLKRIWSDEFSFAVPPYQRPYAWSEEEASALLTDLRGAMGHASAPVSSAPPYFLGAIVVDQTHPPMAQLVDGQRRITTLTILFAALRQLAPGQQRRRLSDLLRPREGDLGHEAAHRLTLRREQDTRFLRDYVLADNGFAKLRTIDESELPDSQQHMAEVARYFERELRCLSASDRQRLAEFALNRCVLVVVGSADRDTSFTAFTVLNKRGLDLSTVDILKADIVGEITNQDPSRGEECATQWEALEESLGRDGFDDLVKAARTIKHPQRPEVALDKEFRKFVIGSRRGLQLADVITNTLDPLGRALHAIRAQNYYFPGAPPQQVKEINRLCEWLNRLGHSEWTPVAIEYLRRKHANPAALNTFFKNLEHLGAYLILLRFTADQRAQRYYQILREMAKDEQLETFQAVRLSPDEWKEMRRRLDRDIYSLPASTRRYLLLRLDDCIYGGNAIYRDEEHITIEHVLPQTVGPRSPWMTAYGGCWATAITRKQWVNRLAILVLLYERPNSRAANSDFATKKQVYFPAPRSDLSREGQAPFALTNQLRPITQWSLETVVQRQVELLARFDEL